MNKDKLKLLETDRACELTSRLNVYTQDKKKQSIYQIRIGRRRSSGLDNYGMYVFKIISNGKRLKGIGEVIAYGRTYRQLEGKLL